MPHTEVVPLLSPKYANNNVILSYDSLNTTEILQIDDAVPKQKKYTAFQQWARLHTNTGKIMREIAAADGAAMVNGIDWNMWQHHQKWLGPLEKLNMRFSMADNSIVPSFGCWMCFVEIGGVQTHQVFEVFDTHGTFFVLLGHPWLNAVQAIQDFHEDTLTIGSNKEEVTLKNDRPGQQVRQ